MDTSETTRSLIARLTTRDGPARPWALRRGALGVIAVPCRYCVTYLLISGRVVVIVDVGSAADGPKIVGALERSGFTAGDVLYLTPTHLHFDHVMGLDALANELGAPIALSRPAYRHVEEGAPLGFAPLKAMWRPTLTWPMQGLPFPPLIDWRRGLDFGTPWGKDRFTAPLGPVLDDGEALPEMPGWSVLLTPGHADDALCLYSPELKLIVTGDVVRNFHGGEWNPFVSDPEAARGTRARLSPLEVEAVLPGHGPVITGLRSMGELLTIKDPVP